MGGQEVQAFEVAFDLGPFVYRLGRHPFTVQRGVRFPYGLSVKGWMRTINKRPDEQDVVVVGWYVWGT